VIRAFIAINLPIEIQKKLEQVSGELRSRLKGVPIRWVPIENIHLTLKFLGDVSESNQDLLKRIVHSEARGYPAFPISVGELGAFPSARQPRVIWIKVFAPPELAAIQHGIEAETARMGYAREDKPFSPHLTLGRISRNATNADVRRVSEVLATFKVDTLGTAVIDAIYLYKSDLRPEGALYTALFSAALSSSS
jgi:2'-5' RNA ligase